MRSNIVSRSPFPLESPARSNLMQSKLFSRKTAGYISTKSHGLPTLHEKAARKGRSYPRWRKLIVIVSLATLVGSSLVVLCKRIRRKKQSLTIYNDENQGQGLSVFPTSPQNRNFTSASPLDFIVAGFPKCGTTSLLFALQPHPEISMETHENCQIARPIQADDVNLKRLDTDIAALQRETPRKVGLKCPDALKNIRAIHRLSLHSPSCRFVIGIRHPVLLLQSFYNYRITALYDKGLENSEVIPTLETVVDSPIPWQDVSLDMVRFELFLVQFAKTSISLDLLEDLEGRNWLGVKPNRFRIFLYTLEQLETDDSQLKESFSSELQHFLGLQSTLPPIGQENRNKFVGDQAHPETIDICESRYDGIRKRVLVSSQRTQTYIRDLIQSNDVVVANREQFLETLQDWDKDPCLADTSRRNS